MMHPLTSRLLISMLAVLAGVAQAHSPPDDARVFFIEPVSYTHLTLPTS